MTCPKKSMPSGRVILTFFVERSRGSCYLVLSKPQDRRARDVSIYRRDEERFRNTPTDSLHTAPPTPPHPRPPLNSLSLMRSSTSFLLVTLASMAVGCFAADPPCPYINMTTVGTLSEPCADPALACSHEQGCVGAMFNWLAPQFEEQRGDFNATEYADVEPKWMIECMAPTLPAWLDAIPISSFMELQKCEYDGYLSQYPELAVMDFSGVTTSDFIRHMPPQMLMDILRAQRSQQ